MRKMLFALGVIGTLIGIATFLVGVFYLRPRANALAATLDRDLRSVEVAVGGVGQRTDALDAALATGSSTRDLVELLPETFITLKGVLLEATRILRRTGVTINKLQGGVAGAVMPQPEVGRNVDTIVKIGEQLSLLEGMTEQMEPVIGRLSADFDRATRGLPELRRQLPELQRISGDVGTRVRSVRETIAGAPIGLAAAALPTFFGGVYFHLGLMSFALSSLLGRSEREGAAAGSPAVAPVVGRDSRHAA